MEITSEQHVFEELNSILAVARLALAEEINLIYAIRSICTLYVRARLPDDEIYKNLSGSNSEFEKYPIGETKALYSEEYLTRLDLEMAEDLAHYGSDIKYVCELLTKKYDG